MIPPKLTEKLFFNDEVLSSLVVSDKINLINPKVLEITDSFLNCITKMPKIMAEKRKVIPKSLLIGCFFICYILANEGDKINIGGNNVY